MEDGTCTYSQNFITKGSIIAQVDWLHRRKVTSGSRNLRNARNRLFDIFQRCGTYTRHTNHNISPMYYSCWNDPSLHWDMQCKTELEAVRRRSIGATLRGSDYECSCANCTRSGSSRRPRTARRPQPPLRRQTRPYCTDASSAAHFNSTRHQQKEASISWSHWELQLYQEKYEEFFCTSIALFSLQPCGKVLELVRDVSTSRS